VTVLSGGGPNGICRHGEARRGTDLAGRAEVALAGAEIGAGGLALRDGLGGQWLPGVETVLTGRE
jgi:hypothetical protein